MEVNRNIAIPLYVQISRIIKEGIDSGEFTKEKPLPSEMDIQKKYDVSRVTARKAYKLLIDQGILRTIKGKGTYINDVDEDDWTWMSSFTRQVMEMGRVPSTKIIKFQEVKSNDIISENLKIPKDTLCYYRKRIRYIDNKPVWLTKSYIPWSIAEDLTKEHFSEKGMGQSIFTVLDINYGIKKINGKEISVMLPISEKDALLLKLEKHKPVVSKAFIGYGFDNKAIIYENTIFDQSISKWK